MKVVASGDRNWTDSVYVFAVFDALHAEHSITKCAHGAARGVDTIVGEWAKSREIPCREYPAIWTVNGKFFKGAGHVRNIEMIDSEKPDLLVAIHPKLAESRGTKHAAYYAKSKGHQVLVCDGFTARELE